MDRFGFYSISGKGDDTGQNVPHSSSQLDMAHCRAPVRSLDHLGEDTKLDIATLVAQAGNALVTAAVTDAWEGVRHKIACLFGHGEADPTMERRLDDSWRQLSAARSTGELGQVQEDLARDWSVRLKDLLADCPDAEAELVALVEDIRPAVAAATDHSVASARTRM